MKSAYLRDLFASHRLIRAVGAHNAVSAQLIERHGFEAVWASGFEISTCHGVPDVGILTMTEILEAATTINRAVQIPVVADCDTGFGNEANATHMVRRFESAGIAAVCIEDQRFPKANSLVDAEHYLEPIESFVRKIEAATRARSTEEFMVIARMEALIAGLGLGEALSRADACVEAGADAILIHSKLDSPKDVFAFARSWRSSTPLVIVPTTYYQVTTADIGQFNKIRMVIYANYCIRAAVRAMGRVLHSLQVAGTGAQNESVVASLEEVFELQGMTESLGQRSDLRNFGRELQDVTQRSH